MFYAFLLTHCLIKKKTMRFFYVINLCIINKNIPLDLKEKSFAKMILLKNEKLSNQANWLLRWKLKKIHVLFCLFVFVFVFQNKWYEWIDWLCASETEEKLDCWPCLLFPPKSGFPWTDRGYSNYKPFDWQQT